MINKCRVCATAFFKEPLLQYKNMPKSAQNFPDKNTIKEDKGIDLNIFQCAGCGLIQLNNEAVSYYRDVIRAAAFSPEMKSFRQKQFKDWVDKYSLIDKKIIEIGCGKGEYLTLMKEVSSNVYGIEHLDESVKYCKSIGLSVEKDFIDKFDYKIKDEPFDAFFILNFLEHLPDINQTLMGICNNLTEDGIGLVEVPNFDMIIEKKMFSEFISDHLFYFTKETLRKTLEMNGFEVLELSVIWHDYIISAVVRKRKRIDITNFYNHQNKIIESIDIHLNKYKNIAVWGAGHESLTILSMIKSYKKIKYVVDSALFKQGKYTLSTHIPIVAPDALNNDPVDAIIVMAASYSDEVAGIIRKKYDKKINVVILRDFGLEKVVSDD